MTGIDLPPLSVRGRIDAVRELLGPAGCDALMVTDPVNIRWCTGFTGSAGVLVISAAAATLITDTRYRDQAPAQLGQSECEAEVEISRQFVESGVSRLDPSAKVGLEADSITWAQHRSWSDVLGTMPIATTAIILGLRSVKNDAEVARIEAAAAIVDASLADAVESIDSGVTEREMVQAIDGGMRSRGAKGPSYDTIVAAGSNSALPHATPGDRVLCPGDLVVVDAGALVDGYCSDMTRTFVVGDEPADRRSGEILELVGRAQRAGLDRVGPGVVAGDVDQACREIIDSAGYAEHFGHGTGHGVGLDVHELPALGKGNTGILQPGHVLTVEPGIYIAGLGGVRIEDTVVVTDDGCRALTRFPTQSTP